MVLDTTLRSIPLFSQLREGDVWRIRNAAITRNYARDSIILFESDAGDALYVVLSGQVKIVHTAEDGREVILATRAKGDFFGELSLIDDQPLTAHVIAMQDSDLLVLRRDDFRRCLAEMPGISAGLLRALCQRLRRADSMIGGLVLLDVKGRVARLILEMASQNDGKTIPKGITHQTISQMIGASRETVSRTLREMTMQGLIVVTGRRIAVGDRASLEAAAQLDELGRVEPPAAATAENLGRRSTDVAEQQ
ncbi:MAG: Crp/Fnr family transcriptional regulator [Gemmatimonadales bacterium]